MSGCKWSLVLVGNVDKEEITAITAAADLYETQFCGAPLAPTGTMTVVAIQSPVPVFQSGFERWGERAQRLRIFCKGTRIEEN